MTLVLNKQGIPVSIVKSRRAITLINSNKAVTLAIYENTLIRSSGALDFNFDGAIRSGNEKISMAIPSVIQCIKSDYIPKIYTNVLPFTRQNVYIRDHGKCMYCGCKVSINGMTFDHVIPRALGGKTCWTNIVISCIKCNSAKGHKPVGKFKEPLRRPYAPRLDRAAPAQLVSRIAAEIPHKTWLDYLYWTVILEP